LGAEVTSPPVASSGAAVLDLLSPFLCLPFQINAIDPQGSIHRTSHHQNGYKPFLTPTFSGSQPPGPEELLFWGPHSKNILLMSPFPTLRKHSSYGLQAVFPSLKAASPLHSQPYPAPADSFSCLQRIFFLKPSRLFFFCTNRAFWNRGCSILLPSLSLALISGPHHHANRSVRGIRVLVYGKRPNGPGLFS